MRSTTAASAAFFFIDSIPFFALASDSHPWLAAMIPPSPAFEVEPVPATPVLDDLERGRHGAPRSSQFWTRPTVVVDLREVSQKNVITEPAPARQVSQC